MTGFLAAMTDHQGDFRRIFADYVRDPHGPPFDLLEMIQ
jgi:hypothetical protein